MAAPLLARLLPHLIKAAGLFGATSVQQQLQDPRSIRSRGRTFFRERGAPETGRWIFGTRQTMPYRREMWGDMRENLQSLMPEVRSTAEVFREIPKAWRDIKQGGIAGVVSALVRMTTATDRASVAMIEMQSVLGQYSAVHAVATAELEVGRIRRSIEMGRTTGPSFRDLTRSRSAFEEAMLPFRQATTIVTDRIVARVLDGLTVALRVLEYLEPITELIQLVMGGGPKPDDPGTAEPFMDALGAGLGVRAPRRRRRV